MKKLEEFDKSKLINSPYKFSFTIPVTKVTLAKKYVVDVSDGSMMNDKIYIDKTDSVKIFKCEGCKDFIYHLSDKAQRLYLYILYNVPKNEDWIQINEQFYMSKNKIKSVNTFKEALKELIRYSFIAPTEFKTVFWINPNLFFSGDRIKKYPNNIDVVQTWDQTAL